MTTGRLARARPTAAMLLGAAGSVLSRTSPLSGLVSCRSYRTVVHWSRSRSSSVGRSSPTAPPFSRRALPLYLTAESQFSPLAEQLQARAGHFLHRINSRGQDPVRDALVGLLRQTVFQPPPPGNA